MAEYRRGPLPRQFDYADYIAETKAKLEKVWQQEDAIRAEREKRQRMELETAELLGRFGVPFSKQQGRAASYHPSIADRPSYWEWDMTTPNTMLCRTGRRGWLR